jgi:hypothetical protein
MNHSRQDAVWGAQVPVVVKSPDDHVVFLDEGEFFGEHWVVFFLGDFAELVEVIIKSGLVSDDQVFSGGGSALQDIEGGHHGYGNAGDFRVGVAGFEGIHGFFLPGDADVVLDALDDFAGG